jgi:hypothetical protein
MVTAVEIQMTPIECGLMSDMMSGGEAGLSIKVNAGVVSRDFLTKVGVVSRGGDLTGSSQTMLEEDA